jgi:diguanylate cyclase (GGDEF)-like protein
MTIKKKALIICFVVSFLCLGLVFLLTRIFVVRNLADAEKKADEIDIQRVTELVACDLSVVGSFAENWSSRDDTYRFVQDGNQTFINDNLTADMFKSQKLNVMLFLDNKKNVIYTKWFDLVRGEEVTEPPEADFAALHNLLVSIESPGNKRQGIIKSLHGPLIIAAQPVTDSLREQPAMGTLIAGRYVDETKLGRVEIKSIDNRANEQGNGKFADGNQTNESAINVSDDQMVAGFTATGYATLKDTAGKDTYLITVRERSYFYNQGWKMLRFFSASLFVTAIFFGLITYYLITRYLLGRLLFLTESISKIKEFKNILHNFRLSGDDEISQLADRLKEIFQELQISRDKLQYISTHDTLTGTYNRAYLEQFLRETPEEFKTRMGIIVFDIDGLKLANEMGGHAYGDKMLQYFGASLRKACPEHALLFRIGGDEFLMLVAEAGEDVLFDICRRVREKVHSASVNSFPLKAPLSVSMGYALFDPARQDFKKALKNADNLMYREKLLHSQSGRNRIVQTLRSALEARDHITEGHALRIHKLAVALARRVGVPEWRMPDLHLFAEFHDLGKIGVADKLLFKKASLSATEKAAMQKHCEIGFRIAQSTTDLLPIADLILKHHEWWNGTGYPMGLAGEDIPIECRILAIVDAYDAMTHDRPYRSALTQEQAFQELARCAGIQFDPDLVKEFFQMQTVSEKNQNERD